MRKLTLTAVLFLLAFFAARAQDKAKMLSYDFKGALEDYKNSLSSTTDSLARKGLAEAVRLADNAYRMTGYCHKPVVVARKSFSKDDFMLHYPLPDKAWRRTNRPDRPVIYHPSPVRDTIVLSQQDSVEIFPMVCGNRRYFASCELPGMGGYDLFVQKRDPVKGCWGEPENMGFPYSSPYDDFLFIDTEDGLYSIFASDRGCSGNSVNVYVLEYDSTPVRFAVNDPAELRSLCALDPDTSGNGSLDAATSEYLGKVTARRATRDKVDATAREMAHLREEYNFSSGAQRDSLRTVILEREAGMEKLLADLQKASAELQQLESRYMQEGIAVDFSAVMRESGKKKFIFPSKDFGLPVNVKYSD